MQFDAFENEDLVNTSRSQLAAFTGSNRTST